VMARLISVMALMYLSYVLGEIFSIILRKKNHPGLKTLYGAKS